MFFTISNSCFLNEFYKCTKEYAYSAFVEISREISLNEGNFYSYFFSQNEIATAIVLNKVIFQNVAGFFEMIDKWLPLPAFNSLRATIEATRLFRAFFIDGEFRDKYIKNKNNDFSNVADYSFMQKEVNKLLDAKEREMRSKDKVPFSSVLSNHRLTKNSAVSKLHSELSKWSHVLNVNLIMPTHISDGEIYLGIDDKYNVPMQQLIKKYTEGMYDVIFTHEQLFSGLSFRKEHHDISDKISEMYMQYIKLFY